MYIYLISQCIFPIFPRIFIKLFLYRVYYKLQIEAFFLDGRCRVAGCRCKVEKLQVHPPSTMIRVCLGKLPAFAPFEMLVNGGWHIWYEQCAQQKSKGFCVNGGIEGNYRIHWLGDLLFGKYEPICYWMLLARMSRYIVLKLWAYFGFLFCCLKTYEQTKNTRWTKMPQHHLYNVPPPWFSVCCPCVHGFSTRRLSKLLRILKMPQWWMSVASQCRCLELCFSTWMLGEGELCSAGILQVESVGIGIMTLKSGIL